MSVSLLGGATVLEDEDAIVDILDTASDSDARALIQRFGWDTLHRNVDDGLGEAFRARFPRHRRLRALSRGALGCALMMLTLSACSRPSCGGEDSIRDTNSLSEGQIAPNLAILSAAAGATRMLPSSPSGDGDTAPAWVVAELGGRWMSEAFGSYQEAPPVLKLLKLLKADRGAVLATANGWALGRPDADGAIYLTTDGAELTYRLAWLTSPGQPAREPTPLKAPPGLWAVKAALPLAGDRAVVVLWRPSWVAPRSEPPAGGQELWLALVDTQSGTVVRAGTWVGMTSTIGIHSGVAAGDDVVYLVDQAGEGSARLVALDVATFAPRWTVALDPPRPLIGQDSAVAVSGDGAHVVVVLGGSRKSGVHAEAGFVVDVARGRVSAVIDAPTLGAATQVHAMVPGGGAKVVYASILDVRDRGESLVGLFAVDANTAAVTTLFDASRGDQSYRRGSVPLALARRPGGGHWIALPPRLDEHTRDARGRDRPEVAGLVETPAGWYQPGRPRIDEWLASLRR